MADAAVGARDARRAQPGYLVVEGPIGVGKTSLARRLAEDFSCRLVLEQVEDNPFLEEFYRDPERMALPTQLYFLTTRLRQLDEIRQCDLFAENTISDFLFDKDRLFARQTLDDRHFDLYLRIHDSLAGRAVEPDLVVYLQAPVEVLARRIEKRGRHFERRLELDYLRRLNAAYGDFFHHYDDAPLLVINTGGIDFVANDSEYRNLKECILSHRAGRNYYNPMQKELYT